MRIYFAQLELEYTLLLNAFTNGQNLHIAYVFAPRFARLEMRVHSPFKSLHK